MNIIIDRRLNQGNKNLGNRQRFIRRTKDKIKQAIKNNIQNRKINDTTSEEHISIPIDGIDEPNFGHDWNTGTTKRVLPGNKDFIPQDKIDRPSGGGSGGRGNEASDSDETGEDEFSFTLTKEEFYDLFFEDLELPDMIRKKLKSTKKWETKRAGISTGGNPSNISIIRTMKQSLGRRLILRKPHQKELQELEEMLEKEQDAHKKIEIQNHIDILKRKIKGISYVDPIDLRYHVFDKRNVPSNSALMICIMDVSGSMDEHKKDLAKRFFMLLYLFLQKKYDNVIVEFVRHHTEAERVDENTFFYDKLTGGTKVSSALILTGEIIKEYDPSLYNVYICQASDGDNWDDDNKTCSDMLQNDLLPLLQYMAYIEIHDDDSLYPLGAFTSTKLYNVYNTVASKVENLQVAKATNVTDIYAVFRKLFEKK